MNITYIKNVLQLLLLSVSLSGPVFAAQVFYTYVDNLGRTHIVDAIPGDALKYGYRVVNDKGVTLREVPSLASQIAKARAAERLTEKQRANMAKRKRNENLLRRFTGLEDIRETGNKKILALQSQIDITNKYIKSYEKNLSLLEKQMSASNNEIDSMLRRELKAIKRLKENILSNQKYVKQRQQEQHKVRDEFLALINDYKKLMAKR